MEEITQAMKRRQACHAIQQAFIVKSGRLSKVPASYQVFARPLARDPHPMPISTSLSALHHGLAIPNSYILRLARPRG